MFNYNKKQYGTLFFRKRITESITEIERELNSLSNELEIGFIFEDIFKKLIKLKKFI